MKYMLVLIVLLASKNIYAGIDIFEAKIYVPLKGAQVTGGYAKFKNNGKEDLSIAVIEAPPFEAVESHITLEEKGRMSMKKVEYFVVKSGDEFVLKPGGAHLMFFNPKKEIKAGDKIRVQFQTMSLPEKKGSNIESDFQVVEREKLTVEHKGH